jgi:hypothetical protein
MTKSHELTMVIIEEIGADIEYIRPQDENLYFTGIDVAMITATQLLVPLFVAYFKAFSAELKSKAKAKGKEHAKLLIQKLEDLAKRFKEVGFKNKEEMNKITSEAKEEIDKCIKSVPSLKGNLLLDYSYIKIMERELIKAGFEQNSAKEHAKNIITKLNKKLNK